MCCESCPRYSNCEEEGHLNDLCCISCMDYGSCHDSAANDEKEDSEADEDESDDI